MQTESKKVTRFKVSGAPVTSTNQTSYKRINKGGEEVEITTTTSNYSTKNLYGNENGNQQATYTSTSRIRTTSNNGRLNNGGQTYQTSTFNARDERLNRTAQKTHIYMNNHVDDNFIVPRNCDVYSSSFENRNYRDVAYKLFKTKPRSNFLYYDSTFDEYKDKGQEAESTYKCRKGKFTTIVKSPHFEEPIAVVIPREEIKQVTKMETGKNMVFYNSNTGDKEERGTTQVKKKVQTVGYTGGEVRYSLTPGALEAILPSLRKSTKEATNYSSNKPRKSAAS